MGTIDALLEASVRGFIQQANSDKVSGRRRRNKQKKDLAQSNAKAG